MGVSLPLERKEVSDSTRGSYVARDLMDTFKVQRLHNSKAAGAVEETEYENVYSVFGVNISGDQVI